MNLKNRHKECIGKYRRRFILKVNCHRSYMCLYKTDVTEYYTFMVMLLHELDGLE